MYKRQPTGIDLREKKLTLPFIYALNNSSDSKRKWLINSVKNGEKKELDKVINYVKEIGGIDYTKNQIKNFYDSALNDLNNFKDNEYKESLKKLIEYVIKRDY